MISALSALAAALVSLATPQVPPGYTATVYARGLVHPTALVVGPAGFLYATEQAGRVVSFSQGASRPRVFASGLADSTLGLVFAGGRLLVADKGRVTAFSDANRDRIAERRTVLLSGLPHKLHQQDNLVLGPDGRIYLGEGSMCNACAPKPREASILSFRPDGTDVKVVATGLRNPFGLAFDAKGTLWATDNGRDDLADRVPDELNRIVPGKRYGFPGCYGIRKGSGCAGSEPAVVELEPHSSADGFAFGPDGAAYVALWGTYYGTRHGRSVVRVDVSGAKAKVTRFATGFDHPLAVRFLKDGAMLVADWGTGIVWRVAR